MSMKADRTRSTRAKAPGNPSGRRMASSSTTLEKEISSESRGVSQSFSDLSTETIVDILLYLKYLQLVLCRRVCTRLRLIIDDTKSLQCVIELGAAGYQRCSSSTNPSDFLDAFRKSQRVYRNPRPKISRKSLSRSSTNGPFSQLWGRFGMNWRITGDIFLSELEDEHKLGILSLRSDVADEDRARILTFTFKINDFGVDQAQNLFVASNGRSLYFMSLHDGLVHGRAANPEISYPDDFTFLFCSMCLYDDWLLVSFVHRDSDGKTNFLYHWPSGELKKTWVSQDEEHKRFFNGCFAQGHLFIQFQDGTSFVIDVYRLPDACSVQDPIVHVASYVFPERQPNRYIPILEAVTAAVGQTFKPTCSMLRLTFGSAPSIFISLDAFEAAFAIELHNKPLRKPISVPWGNWGLKYTRFVESDGEVVAFGRRAIYRNTILDFNPYDLVNDVYGPTISPGRSLRNTHEDDYSGTVRTAGSALPEYIGFPGPHLTTLPYRKTHLVMPIPRQDSLFSVFEEDGVQKLVRIVFAASGIPKFLHIITL